MTQPWTGDPLGDRIDEMIYNHAVFRGWITAPKPPCQATTHAGNPCRKKAQRGRNYCNLH